VVADGVAEFKRVNAPMMRHIEKQRRPDGSK